MTHPLIFSHKNRKCVYCARINGIGMLEILVCPARGKGYTIGPSPERSQAFAVAVSLLFDIGLYPADLDRITPLLAALPLFQRQPPWEVTETELRTFASATEAFR